MDSSVDLPAPRSARYLPAELFSGWTAADPLSAGRTLDMQTWLTAQAGLAKGPESLIEITARAVHDASISWLLEEHIEAHRCVAIMGGHSISRTDELYQTVARIAFDLASEGITVFTGGGPGAMEAAHLGARCAEAGSAALGASLDCVRADHARAKFPFRNARELLDSNGNLATDAVRALHAWQAPAFAAAELVPNPTTTIGIPTWHYGHEPPTPLATHHAKYFQNSVREDGLLTVATGGVIFAQGSAGTLQEIFQDAAQNYYAPSMAEFYPMVLLDIDECWSVTYPIRMCLERLFSDDQERQVTFASTAEEAVAAILAHASRE